MDAVGAPAAAVYQSHSGSIVETLDDLKAKAESQLTGARHTETTASHNFQLLKQSLEDEMKFDAQYLEDPKMTNLSETQSQLAADTTDLKIRSDTLAEDSSTRRHQARLLGKGRGI